MLKRALHTFSSAETALIHKKINKLLTQSTNVGVLNSLLENTMSCRSKYIPQFIGFEIQSTRVDSISDLLSDSFPYAKNIGQLLHQIFLFERKCITASERDKKFINPETFFKKYPKVKLHYELSHLATEISE